MAAQVEDKLLRYKGNVGLGYVLNISFLHVYFIFSLLSSAVLSISSFVTVQMKQVFLREVTELNTYCFSYLHMKLLFKI